MITLFVTARAWEVTALLRELKATTGGWARVSVEAFVLGLLGLGRGLPAFGLELIIEGGRVDLCTTPVGDAKFDAWLNTYQTAGPARISQPMLEALAMVALKQPVTAAEIAYIYITTPCFIEPFGADAISRMKEATPSRLPSQ